jgi:hypothetical protein
VKVSRNQRRPTIVGQRNNATFVASFILATPCVQRGIPKRSRFITRNEQCKLFGVEQLSN